MDDAHLSEEREARIRELEHRLVRRPSLGVKWPVALVGIGASLLLLWQMRLDLAYHFAPKTAVSLGSEGNYRFEHLGSNHWAQVHGVPTLRGAYYAEGGQTYVVVGLKDTPLLVKREAFASEQWHPGTPPPQPVQTPFAVRGRLLSRQDASRYEDGFRQMEAMGEVRPQWILLQGERPGESVSTWLWMTGLLVFLTFNAWFLYRDVSARFGRQVESNSTIR